MKTRKLDFITANGIHVTRHHAARILWGARETARATGQYLNRHQDGEAVTFSLSRTFRDGLLSYRIVH